MGEKVKMKITIEPTTKIVHLNGLPARIWEGVTEKGVPCYLFVTRIAVSNDESAEEFESALEEKKPPSIEVPLRMII